MNSMDREREIGALAKIETIGRNLPPAERFPMLVVAYAFLTGNEETRNAIVAALEARVAECRTA